MARREATENSPDKTYIGCYGHVCKASQVVDWAVRLCEDNFISEIDNLSRWTGNIWGHAGCGKTSLMKQMCKYPIEYNGVMYNGFSVIVVPLAQIEEMGDILGVPDDFILMERDNEQKWVLAKDSVINYWIARGYEICDSGRVVTRYAPPAWVPTEEKPGIIIFDDGNRASIRIQKGIMQLIQDYKTIGWEIPKGWTIIFTGNPDNQNYLVTTVDEAIITRQSHITMKADAVEWSIWATGARVDRRGINFILQYPEMMIGNRSNPRTLTQFFRRLKRYDQIEPNRERIIIDGKSLIDEETVTSFMVYATRDMNLVIEPIDVLENIDKVIPEINKLMNGSEPRVDIMGVVCDRLYAHIIQEDYVINPGHIQNFQQFVLYDRIPEDMRHSLMRRIADVESNKRQSLSKFLTDNKAILNMVAKSMRIVR